MNEAVFKKPCVVLLHGLARSARAMQPLEKILIDVGFEVFNIDYPSRQHRIEILTEQFVLPKIQALTAEDDRPLQFVTHSMGGIILRCLTVMSPRLKIGRSVMLAPPNQGSELVDKMGHWPLFKLIYGPAGQQLGTSTLSLPNQLGRVFFELGIIAGDRPINPSLARLIAGANDGKVSVQRTWVKGAKATCILPCTHSFMMTNIEVQQQLVHFMQSGLFSTAASK